jgi:DnaJ-class molecular chaperone
MDPLAILGGALMLGAVYYVSVRLWPYARCRSCTGSGKNAGSNRKRWGPCRRCGGSGKRERLGTRLFFRRR